MKQKLFEELHNLSKDRKWPANPTDKSSDKYFTYDLKEDYGKYLIHGSLDKFLRLVMLFI
jgi:hypothetical protein